MFTLDDLPEVVLRQRSMPQIHDDLMEPDTVIRFQAKIGESMELGEWEACWASPRIAFGKS